MRWRWGLLPAASVLVASVAAAAASGSSRVHVAAFPRSDTGIQLEMVFDYKTSRGFGFPDIDAIWSASQPVRGRYSTFYLPFDRDQNSGLAPAWWLAHHPTWIEYRCDRRTWATESGDPNAPLDVGNPAVRRWQWSHEILPAMAQGYQGVAFDNLNLDNYHGRCGHYDQQGRWVSQFAQKVAYQNSVLSWALFMRSKLHRIGRTFNINFSYEEDVPAAANQALAGIPDLLFDEAGVTQGGSRSAPPITVAHWQHVLTTARAVEARGACYDLNGEEPQDTAKITLRERAWILGNYLLMRGRCTFVYITGYRTYALAPYRAPIAGRDQDYGTFHLFPEYRLAIGRPLTGPMQHGCVWIRRYSAGLVVVNPSHVTALVRIGRPLYPLHATAARRSFSLPADSAEILMPRRTI